MTTVSLGTPDVELALRQHAAYCAALERHGCQLVVLPPDDTLPDSTFVEDTALIVPGHGAILTRPGAESRLGEVDAVNDALRPIFGELPRIVAPGTLDAGDVCEAGPVVFIGVSHRTNAEGARQLAVWLASHGIETRVVDIRATAGILHLKSGVVALDVGRVCCIAALAGHPAFADHEVILVPDSEAYAANCVRVNDVLLVADGFPSTHAMLHSQGYTLAPLEISEFARMDGGLSCLSLRW